MPQLQRLVISMAQLKDQTFTLSVEQQHYLSHVLRLRVGDRFIAMNGQGQAWITQLLTDAARIIELVTVETELPISIMLMVTPPKGNGLEDVIRQATEIGVSVIQPVLSARTVLNPSPHKLERWRRIAQEAAEQSERQIVPSVCEPIALMESLQVYQAIPDTLRYLCVTRLEAPHLLSCSRSWTDQLKSVAIATGPEGGWTDAEVQAAIAASFQPVSLGTRILRAVTAPLVAATLVAAVCESRT
jgi:16S rRNA (uracil1498-N3)-methyltransferase